MYRKTLASCPKRPFQAQTRKLCIRFVKFADLKEGMFFFNKNSELLHISRGCILSDDLG